MVGEFGVLTILQPLFLAEVSCRDLNIKDGNGIGTIRSFFEREDGEWIGGRSFWDFRFLELRKEGTGSLSLEVEVGLWID